MHEHGHNLGLAHSGGLDGDACSDRTCMMGTPLYSDDIGKMCFNPAKNWKLGWYSNSYVTFDPDLHSCWSGVLIGVGEWDYGQHGLPVVLKIETNTKNDYFVGFNRAAGPNAQNVQASDEVTIIKTGKNGNGYSQSRFKANLNQGQSYVFANWKGTDNDLEVTVNSIDMSSIPATAEITIQIGNGCTTLSPTSLPTSYPITISPTKSITKKTTTLPSYSPSIEVTSLPSTSPTSSPTNSPTNSPTHSPTKSPTNSPTSPPTSSPTKSNTCIICDDVETNFMRRNGINCTTANNLYRKCNKDFGWTRRKNCQYSCFNAGYGYENNNCCNKIK